MAASSDKTRRRWSPLDWWSRLASRHPFVGLFLVIIWPNGLWSVANLVYNDYLIVARFCNDQQKDAFWLAVPPWTVLTWVLGMGTCVWLLRPVYLYLQATGRGADIPASVQQAARRRLVNFSLCALLVNFLLWLPGGIYFPSMICALGGTDKWYLIGGQFIASFVVSAVVTTFQTFVILERFLHVYLYPRVFTDVSAVEVEGGMQQWLPFQARMWFLWAAVSLGPLIVLVLITANLLLLHLDETLFWLTVGVVLFGIATGGVIFWVVGRDLAGWLEQHVSATAEIRRENFGVRISELRSDEWGRLTDAFNKMARDLSLGRQVRETFGQFVGPEVRDEILKHSLQLGGKVQEVTVMFADIRGFTHRAAGKAPEEVVELLNRFLSLAVSAIEEAGGWVNKFLGDGFMALFGTPLPRSEHADCAVAAARDLLCRLDGLNRELEEQGQPPLRIGIGIHTGPALVGCVGATVRMPDGRERMRLEFTAIGETVNLSQRLEELTKKCALSLLLSEATRQRLQRPPQLTCLGPHEIRGSTQPLIVYSVK